MAYFSKQHVTLTIIAILMAILVQAQKFNGVGVEISDVRDSADCMKNCLRENKIFCRGHEKERGKCCEPFDNNCRRDSSGNPWPICSNKFSNPHLKAFTCPFETKVCQSERVDL